MKTLPAHELFDLIRRWQQQGDTRARNLAVESNLGLVHKLARVLARPGIDHDDLAQQGVLGLMRAVDKFDIERCCSFSSYAAYWIRSSMTEWIFRNWSVCGSRKLLRGKMFFRVVRARRAAMAQTSDRTEIVDRVSLDLDLPPQVIEEFFYRMDHRDLSLDKRKFDGDSDESEVDDLPSIEATPEQRVIDNQAFRSSRASLNQFLTRLSDQQRRVVLAIMHDDEITLQEIGDRLGISRQRVQQIRDQAFKHIQASAA